MSYYTLYIMEDFEAMTLFHLFIGISVIAIVFLLFFDMEKNERDWYLFRSQRVQNRYTD